jgi:phosphopantetheinyl transferase (holo-ACP synthase)
LIGNDIIDLNLAERESDWQREGFLQKQFTKKEQAFIHNAENSFEMVWLFWSMKESAYKIWAQLHEERIFAPLKFECELTSEDEGIVSSQDQKVYTSSILDGYYIFTIASLKKETKVYSEIGPPYGIEDRVKKKLQEETGILTSEIEQEKSKNGAPNYYHKNEVLIKSCSISHHGNYGAFSLLFN